MSADFTAALDGTNEITITVTGRATGRQIALPVWFVEERGKIDLLPVHGSDGDWYKNVLVTPRMELAADGAAITAPATPITDPALVQARRPLVGLSLTHPVRVLQRELRRRRACRACTGTEGAPWPLSPR